MFTVFILLEIVVIIIFRVVGSSFNEDSPLLFGNLKKPTYYIEAIYTTCRYTLIYEVGTHGEGWYSNEIFCVKTAYHCVVRLVLINSLKFQKKIMTENQFYRECHFVYFTYLFWSKKHTHLERFFMRHSTTVFSCQKLPFEYKNLGLIFQLTMGVIS